MHSLLSHVLLFGAALSLMGPQGWCCFVAQPARQESTPAPEASCPCHQPAPAKEKVPHHPDHPNQLPRPCCLLPGGALPTNQETLNPLYDVAHAPVIPAPLPLMEGTTAVNVEPRPPLLPPLQLLHCVWLC
jgi:hypothetical protein